MPASTGGSEEDKTEEMRKSNRISKGKNWENK
jgi:hypothetical protein